MARWRRVDTPRTFFQLTVPMIGVTLAFVVAVVVATAGRPLTAATVVGFAVAALLVLVAVRAALVGVFFGERGVRSRSLTRTRTVPWVSIEAFEDRVAVHNPWNPGSGEPVRAIWIVRLDGEAIQTPLVYLDGRFYVPGRPVPRNRWIWTRAECHAARSQLARALARSRPGRA